MSIFAYDLSPSVISARFSAGVNMKKKLRKTIQQSSMFQANSSSYEIRILLCRSVGESMRLDNCVE
jgi:hypothetical protein